MTTSVFPAGHSSFFPPRCTRKTEGANSRWMWFSLQAPASRDSPCFQGAIISTPRSLVFSTLSRVAYPLSAMIFSGSRPQFCFTFSSAGISCCVSLAAVVTWTATDHARPRFGGDLHVVTRSPSSVRLLHVPRLRLALAHSQPLPLGGRRLLLQFLQFRQRSLGALQRFPRCPFLRRLPPLLDCSALRSAFTFRLRFHLFHYLLRSPHPLFQRFAPMQRAAPRHRSHLRAVLQQGLQIHQADRFQKR